MAEVLITLGIIGVVAALTLPSVIQKYKEKETVVSLTQTYNLLSQALEHMIKDYGYVQNWGETAEQRVAKFEELMPKYLNVVKKCAKGRRGCIAKEYKYGLKDAGDETISGTTGISYTYLLKNGVALKVNPNGTCQQDLTLSKKGCSEFDSHCENSSPTLNYGTYLHRCMTINVDLNGPAGPNKYDIDAFAFAVVQDGIVPQGSSKEVIYLNKFEDTCVKFSKYNYGNCTAWVIYNKNMDYLHCPNELSWSGKSSCKD